MTSGMEVSIFLAKIWGSVFIVLSLAFLLNRKNLVMMFQMARTRDFTFLSGIVNFVIGVAMISQHNIWTTDWRVFVTIIGWAALGKGVLRLFAPDLSIHLTNKFRKRSRIRISFYTLIIYGFFLLYFAIIS